MTDGAKLRKYQRSKLRYILVMKSISQVLTAVLELVLSLVAVALVVAHPQERDALALGAAEHVVWAYRVS